MDLFNQPLEQVLYVSSPVVESIAIVCAMTKNNQQFLVAELEQFQQLFQFEPVIEHLKQVPENTLYYIYNLLIPIPNLTSVEQFAEKQRQMKNDYFVYYFWSEDIAYETVQQLVQNPSSIWDLEPTYYWQEDAYRELYVEWLSNIAQFKEGLADLLVKIADSEPFKQIITTKKAVVQNSIESVKQLTLEPLLLAQYVMGKTFRRVSLYKMYYFLPSYCISPARIRIFNESVCYVIYGCANPISDDREKSEQLARQLKAISDPNRILMLRMLAAKKEYGAKLAEYLGITTATVSHHIETLKKAGLVKEEKIGTIKYFTVNSEQINHMLHTMQLFLKA